jgi:DNA mismatch repair protein MSH5
MLNILDAEKQEYSGMQDLLTSVAQLELDDLPDVIGQCTVNYVPEMGYMLAVPLWDDNLSEADVQIPNLQLLVISSLYYFVLFYKFCSYF